MSIPDYELEPNPAALAVRKADWPWLEQLPQRLAAANQSSDAYRGALIEAQAELARRFHADEPVESLVRARASRSSSARRPRSLSVDMKLG